METDATHLRRVLTGQRKGSQALLQAVMDAAETMQGRRVHRSSDEVDHLIEAAAHMFFLQRGDFESAIFLDPDEMHTGLYGPGPRKGRTRGKIRNSKSEIRKPAIKREPNLVKPKTKPN